MISVWRETELPRFPKLKGDVKTDVLIIGGGIAGILTAYFLQMNGIGYVLAEKSRICGGNTQNTTAKITAQHGLIYSKLIRCCGEYTAKQYLRANLAALGTYAELCRGVDCGFETKDNFVYSADPRRLESEMQALSRLGYGAELCEKLPIPVKTAGAVRFPAQAQFNPLKFLAAVSRGLNIYEDTFVREMKGNTAVTDEGRIIAGRVVCATHFPFINKHGLYFLKLYQSRSYVTALENAPDFGGMYVDDEDSGLSFRNYGGLLLLGGGGGRTGKRCGAWDELRSFARANWPEAREKYCWAAQDCMSLDSMPYIGRYGSRTENFYVETGFNKWGMTGSMLAAMIISDALAGRRNEFGELFDPSRSILRPQLFINGAEALLNLLTPSKRVCPHMGCALKWNGAEHSWDCPCHGSRFSESGKLLDNPANGDIGHR